MRCAAELSHAGQAGGPPQLGPRLGGDDLRLDGHQATVGRVLAPQRDPLPDGDVASRLYEQRVPVSVTAQVGQDVPYLLGGASTSIVAVMVFIGSSAPALGAHGF
jgi:hypothetical protein